MMLLDLAAIVCRTLTEEASETTRSVHKVKAGHPRDVVTSLDTMLHTVTARFVTEHLPRCTLLSEEGQAAIAPDRTLMRGEWLIVDPLDGSSNYAMGLPHYGYMATHLDEGIIQGGVMVVPEDSQYIVFEAAQLRTARPVARREASPRGGIYYAYPPRQDATAYETRMRLSRWIDETSAGMYRYGAACVGLYQVARGAHRAFIGHEIRIWDAMAALPILTALGAHVRYRITGGSISIVAGYESELVSSAAAILARDGHALAPYAHGNRLNVATV